jgi:hypothetical protein
VAEKKAEPESARGRLAELRDRVERAARLIAELREANFALKGEIVELQRKLEEAGSAPGPTPSPSPMGEAASEVHEELQLLRDERKIIRARVQNLLERIEGLDI